MRDKIQNIMELATAYACAATDNKVGLQGEQERNARLALEGAVRGQLAAQQVAQQLPEIKDMLNAPQFLNNNDRAFWVLGWNGCRDAAKPLIARIAELEAQAAHMADLAEQADYARRKMEEAQAKVQKLEASQARVPLSDERVDGINRLVTGTVFGRIARGRAIARAIEAAHGITQEQG